MFKEFYFCVNWFSCNFQVGDFGSILVGIFLLEFNALVFASVIIDEKKQIVVDRWKNEDEYPCLMN